MFRARPPEQPVQQCNPLQPSLRPAATRPAQARHHRPDPSHRPQRGLREGDNEAIGGVLEAGAVRGGGEGPGEGEVDRPGYRGTPAEAAGGEARAKEVKEEGLL